MEKYAADLFASNSGKARADFSPAFRSVVRMEVSYHAAGNSLHRQQVNKNAKVNGAFM